MKPQVVARELGKRLEDDAIVCGDSGTITTWAARHIGMRGARCFRFAAISRRWPAALPYAIGAQIAFPDRQVVAFVGDGGLYDADGRACHAACKYKLPVKIVVIKNNALGPIKWEQMVFIGNPEYGWTCTRSTLSRSPRPAARRACTSRTPRTAAAVWTRRSRIDGPVVFEAWSTRRAADAAEDHGEQAKASRRSAGARRGEPRQIGLTIAADTVRSGPRRASPYRVIERAREKAPTSDADEG